MPGHVGVVERPGGCDQEMSGLDVVGTQALWEEEEKEEENHQLQEWFPDYGHRAGTRTPR